MASPLTFGSVIFRRNINAFIDLSLLSDVLFICYCLSMKEHCLLYHITVIFRSYLMHSPRLVSSRVYISIRLLMSSYFRPDLPRTLVIRRKLVVKQTCFHERELPLGSGKRTNAFCFGIELGSLARRTMYSLDDRLMAYWARNLSDMEPNARATSIFDECAHFVSWESSVT